MMGSPETLEWYEAVRLLRAHIVRIETPAGSGTGFFLGRNKAKNVEGIATAAHVVGHAGKWGDRIRLVHQESGKTIVLPESHRVILPDSKSDTAAVMFVAHQLPLPTEALQLADADLHLEAGGEIGWLGFPAAIEAERPCFFRGSISCWIDVGSYYLVDGVAINGVSGSPAFHRNDEKNLDIIGVVSAYIANRATGEALPGLSVVRSVLHLRNVLEALANLDQAREQAKERSETTEAGSAVRVAPRG